MIDITNSKERIFTAPITIEKEDAEGEIVNLESVEDALPYMMMKGGVITYMHTDDVVGKLIGFKKEDDRILGIGQIYNTHGLDDNVWDLVKQKKLGFSIKGSKFLTSGKEVVVKDLYSITLTDHPAIREKVDAVSFAKEYHTVSKDEPVATATQGANNPRYSDEEKKKLYGIVKATQENNPWAICTAQLGTQEGAEFESCVMDLKEKFGIKKDVNGGSMTEEKIVKQNIEIKKQDLPAEQQPVQEKDKMDLMMEHMVALEQRLVALESAYPKKEPVVEEAKAVVKEEEKPEEDKEKVEMKKEISELKKETAELKKNFETVRPESRPVGSLEKEDKRTEMLKDIYKTYGIN